MKLLKGKISVIMPAYNEGRRIFNNIEETVRTLEEFGCTYEVIVVNDGSKDNTAQEIMRAQDSFKHIVLIHNRENYGKGRALKKGFRSTKGDYVVFLDSDMDLHPVQLQTFIDIMRLDEADVVIGSKRHPNSKLEYPAHRRMISFVYFFLIKVIFGLPIKDTQTGLKLFRRDVFKIKAVFSRVSGVVQLQELGPCDCLFFQERTYAVDNLRAHVEGVLFPAVVFVTDCRPDLFPVDAAAGF